MKSSEAGKLAAKYGVTIRTISSWRAEGAPFNDPKAMREWVGNRRTLTDATANTLGGGGARDELRNIQAQKTQKQIQLLELRRQQVSKEIEAESTAIARRVISSVLLPIRTELSTLPIRLAARCNPTDPELARIELEHAVAEILKQR